MSFASMHNDYLDPDRQMEQEPSDALGRITRLIELMQGEQQQIEFFEKQINEHKGTLRRIEFEDLPELMSEYGLKSLELEDGSIVKIDKNIVCSISEARRQAAHQWLTDHGFGGLIKSWIEMKFGRDDRDAALEEFKRLESEGEFDIAIVEKVEPQTLKAFVREQIEAGKPPPTDLFGIYPMPRAKITAPRKGK